MSTATNDTDQLPKGKKKSPLGKWLLAKRLNLNNLPVGKRNKHLLLTTVSNSKDYSQRLNSGQNPDPDSYRESDTTGDDSPDEAKLVGSDDSDEYQTPSEMLIRASA